MPLNKVLPPHQISRRSDKKLKGWLESYYYVIRKVTFIDNLLFTNNVMILTLHNTVAKSEISTCAAKFKGEEHNFNWKHRSIVHDHFKGELGL